MKIIIIVLYLIILSIYDIRTQKIPVKWLAVGSVAVVGTIVREISDVLEVAGSWQELWPALWQEFGQELLTGWLPGLAILGACVVTGRVGSADGWVLLIVGSMLSSGQMMAAFGCSMILIAIMAGVLLLLKRAGKNDRLPYLPFLTAAVVLVQL